MREKSACLYYDAVFFFTFVPRLASGYGALAIPPFLGAIAGTFGVVTAGIATSTWDESGAPDVTVAKNRPVQVGFRYVYVYGEGVYAYRRLASNTTTLNLIGRGRIWGAK